MIVEADGSAITYRDALEVVLNWSAGPPAFQFRQLIGFLRHHSLQPECHMTLRLSP
jgi:hypothetical protein